MKKLSPKAEVVIPLQQRVVNPSSVSYDIFKEFKCKFDVLAESHDFGITSEYERGFIDALNEVYKLLYESEMPF